MILTVGNEKGGVGKSTLALTIADWFSKQNFSVALVDTDSQSTASKWGELRSNVGLSHDFLIVDKSIDSTAAVVQLSEKYDVVVVDVGARDYARMIDLARIADLWIAPTRVGQADLQSTFETVEAFQEADSKHKNGHIPIVVAINVAPAQWNSTEGKDAQVALREILPDTPVLESIIRDRKVWRDAHKLGKTILELPKADREKAQAEFEDLMNEALKQYKKFQKGSK